MIGFRFAENLSKHVCTPFVLMIAQGVKYETKFEPLNEWIPAPGVSEC